VGGFKTITPFTEGVGRLLDTSGVRSVGKTRNYCANRGNMASAVDGDPETIWQCPKQIAISFRATKAELAVFRAASMRGAHGYGGTVDVYVSASGGTGNQGFEMQNQPDKYTFVGQIIFDQFGFTRMEFEPIEGKSIHFLFNETTADGEKMAKARPTISEVTIEAGVSPKGYVNMGEGGDYGYANGSRRTVR